MRIECYFLAAVRQDTKSCRTGEILYFCMSVCTYVRSPMAGSQTFLVGLQTLLAVLIFFPASLRFLQQAFRLLSADLMV